MQKAWKRVAYQEALDDIVEIEDTGHDVQRCTDWHWKINGIDVYPSSRKYLKNGIVKTYQKLKDIL